MTTLLILLALVYSIIFLSTIPIKECLYKINKFLNSRKKDIELRVMEENTDMNVHYYTVEERVHTIFGKRWKPIVYNCISIPEAIEHLKKEEGYFYNRVKPSRKIIYYNKETNKEN